MDALTVTDQASAAVQKTPNRVSLDSIKAKIAEVEYHNPALCPHLTVAYVKLANGFVVIGQSAPADPENFDADLGRQFAMENAIRQVWPLEGYALRERMTAD